MATPDDKDLQQLQSALGLSQILRVGVSRTDAVAARLIKPHVETWYLQPDADSAPLSRSVSWLSRQIELAITRHKEQRVALEQAGIKDLMPLLLVQVASGHDDAVAEARQALVDAGMPDSAIRAHTADKPDSKFQQIADDHDVQALIFKVAVATGFDAPRAFTLVSLRSSRSQQFGFQLIGRILRVHPRLRALKKIPEKLRHGHLYLLDQSAQAGLAAAADTIKSIKAGVATHTLASAVVRDRDGNPLTTPSVYSLREGIPLPQFFTQRNHPSFDIEDLERLVAQRVHVEQAVLKAALATTLRAGVEGIKIFSKDRVPTQGEVAIPVDRAEIARRALAVISALPEVDHQRLVRELMVRLEAEFKSASLGPVDSDQQLHAVHVLGQMEPPNPVLEALRRLRLWTATRHSCEPLPGTLESDDELPASRVNVYGVVPADWDSPDEGLFAQQWLEASRAPLDWWHRNPDTKPHSVGLARSTGGMFFPDFVVGLRGEADAGQATAPVLIEVKGAGWLDSDKVRGDFACNHPDYGRALFVTEIKGRWLVVREDRDTGKLVPGDAFSWEAVLRFAEERRFLCVTAPAGEGNPVNDE